MKKSKKHYVVEIAEIHVYESNGYVPKIFKTENVETWAVSEKQAINNAKFRLYGKGNDFKEWSHDECRYCEILSVKEVTE